MIYGSIICLGDSLTSGARDDFYRGYPIELELLLFERFRQNWNCINAGVNGEISVEIYKRAYDVLRSYPEASEVILLCGTNDAKEQIRTPPYKFSEHVEAIIRCAQRFEKILYLCLIPDLRGFGAPDFCDENLIKVYNSELQAIANTNEVKLVDLRGLDPDCYADGVHLNNKGYREVARRVLSVIEERRFYIGKSDWKEDGKPKQD